MGVTILVFDLGSLLFGSHNGLEGIKRAWTN
ncbi:MAG: hypothetical protein KatS3mg109_1085 [Pirellulaceae bacterium]|nr:MAG: hypothetical protein KatS3mg109_1044 [Pirellulaceae bacterium]GIW90653.1 MAG: hypothetical protein KatS3mg109_1085 [Pirellulaceae bacterium]GIW93648.1 MAG: hypothetical protein KatS3mg110_1689 [Pirellulaceae bacterium]